MDLRKLLSFKDWFSYRQKIGLLVVAGVVCGLGGLFMYLLRAHTYFVGDNPSACVNCHIMTPYYATWSHSSHGRDATCNDCHVPHQNLGFYYGFKAVDGLKHTAYFVTHSERQAPMAEAQQAIGLDMQKLNEKKQKFLDEIVPKWIDEAKKNGKLIEI